MTARPDNVSQMGRTRRGGWPRALESAGRVTGPLILACLYVLTKVAVIGHLIPGRWDKDGSVLSALLFAAAIILVAAHSCRLAQHARLVEQQRQDWASRTSCVIKDSADDMMPAVRDLAGRVEMCEIGVAALAGTVTDMCAEADVPELADRAGLRLVRPESRRPAV
jgi:hypothetical protein